MIILLSAIYGGFIVGGLYFAAKHILKFTIYNLQFTVFTFINNLLRKVIK